MHSSKITAEIDLIFLKVISCHIDTYSTELKYTHKYSSNNLLQYSIFLSKNPLPNQAQFVRIGSWFRVIYQRQKAAKRAMALAKLLEAKTFTLHNGLKMENGVVSQLLKRLKLTFFEKFSLLHSQTTLWPFHLKKLPKNFAFCLLRFPKLN